MATSDEQNVGTPASGRLSGVLELQLPAPEAQKTAGQETFIRIAVLGGLFLWLHYDLLDWLVQSWWQNPNWSHGFLMPLFSLYLLYCRWGELKALEPLEFAPRKRPNIAVHLAVVAGIVLLGVLAWFGLHLGSRGLMGKLLGWFWPTALLVALWVRQYGRQNRAARWLLFGLPCRAGLILVIMFLLAEVAIMGVRPNHWLLGLSMIGMLFGLTMYLNGLRAMKLLWLPIVFLCMAIPIPDSQYNPIAYRLQEVAAGGARQMLGMLDVEITRKASNLQLTSVSGKICDLTVAEACSGMRLLMAFFALGVATAYLGVRPLWQRVTLVVAAIPIAILCNVLRVSITGWMYYIDRPELGKDVLHTATGMLMLIPAFAMLWILGWLLEGASWIGNRLFEPDVETDEDGKGSEKAAAGKGDGQ